MIGIDPGPFGIVVSRRGALLRDDIVTPQDLEVRLPLLPEVIDTEMTHDGHEVVGDVLEGLGLVLKRAHQVRLTAAGTGQPGDGACLQEIVEPGGFFRAMVGGPEEEDPVGAAEDAVVMGYLVPCSCLGIRERLGNAKVQSWTRRPRITTCWYGVEVFSYTLDDYSTKRVANEDDGLVSRSCQL